jgi:hypothetical protein
MALVPRPRANREETGLQRKPPATRGRPVLAGSTRAALPGHTRLGLLHFTPNQYFRANQRSTTCVVPPVAAAAERPPGADAASTSTPSCPGSPRRSDAPATQRTSGPYVGSPGAKAEAPETCRRTPASRTAAPRSRTTHRAVETSARSRTPTRRQSWASSSLMRSASD